MSEAVVYRESVRSADPATQRVWPDELVARKKMEARMAVIQAATQRVNRGK